MSTTMATVQQQQNENGKHDSSNQNANLQQAYQATFSPRFDLWEGDQEMILYGDLPGVDPDKLEIEFQDRQLMIRGQVCRYDEGLNLLRPEYAIGDYQRKFTITEAINSEGITAELRDGVLTIRLPKVDQVKPRRIQVNSSN